MSKSEPLATLKKLEENYNFVTQGFDYTFLHNSDSLGFSVTYDEADISGWGGKFTITYMFIDNEYFRCWTLDKVEYETPHASIGKTFNEEPPFRARAIGDSSVVEYEDGEEFESVYCHLGVPTELIEKLTHLETQFMP